MNNIALSDASLGPEVPTEKIRGEKGKKWMNVWVWGLNIMYYFPGILPFRIRYDPVACQILIMENKSQKIYYYTIQFCSLYVLWKNLLGTVEYVRTSNNALSYFDLLFFITAAIHGMRSRYILIFGRKKLQNYFNQVTQQSHLVELSSDSWTKLKTGMWVIFILSYTAPAVTCYYCSLNGIDTLSLTTLVESTKIQAMGVLGISEEKAEDIPNVVTFFIGFVNYYELCNLMAADVLAITGIYFMAFVTDDVTKSSFVEDDLGEETTTTKEGIRRMESLERLFISFNDVFGFTCCTYSVYCNSYYAIHFVELLNDTDLRNRYLVVTQLSGLIFSYINALSICNNGIKMARWLSRKNRALELEPQQLSLLRFNLENDCFAVGSLFKVTSTLVGELVAYMCTIAMVAVNYAHEASDL